MGQSLRALVSDACGRVGLCMWCTLTPKVK